MPLPVDAEIGCEEAVNEVRKAKRATRISSVNIGSQVQESFSSPLEVVQLIGSQRMFCTNMHLMSELRTRPMLLLDVLVSSFVCSLLGQPL